MARCRLCGCDFPTSPMDTVAICPDCGTVYANESSTLDEAAILEYGKSVVGFSPETLRRIQIALDQAECRNSYFSMQITETELISSFGYGEGFKVYYKDGAYHGINSRERAVDYEQYENEEQAADRFIRFSSAGKRML